MAKVYDGFIFFNELDLLEMRLHELDQYVDYFVLCEAGETHAGTPKKLFFEQHKSRFAQFLPKLIHVVIPAFPGDWNALECEIGQRNAIFPKSLALEPDDILLISDLDEIPLLDGVNLHAINQPSVFIHQTSYYFLNNQIVEPQDHREWRGTVVTRAGWNKVPQSLRDARKELVAINGGWHFSFMGGVEQIQLKLKSFLHQEFNKPEYTDADRIMERIRSNIDPFGRPFRFRQTSVDRRYPQYVLNNLEKFGKYLITPEGSFAHSFS